ncbi:MAG: hypothetical protein WA372_19705 [Candidatus Sulfotelmatobacter sp.]
MEALTRLVTDSLARHGFDRPIDPRRLQWSNWFRCDSPHSLLVVPSKPGIFAIAEEIMDICTPHVGTAAPGCPAEQTSAYISMTATAGRSADREGHDFSSDPALGQPSEPLGGAALQRCGSSQETGAALAAEVTKRMLAVLQFSEDDDMAFTLDRMFTRINPMRARLTSGNCFLRFVVIQDQAQRRSICSALNQWMLSSAEKASGIPAGFSSSLEVSTTAEAVGVGTPRVGRTLLSADADTVPIPAAASPQRANVSPLPHLDSGANKNLHCPHPLPFGF